MTDGNHVHDLDELKHLDEQTWEEIHTYCNKRYDIPYQERGIDSKEVDIMKGVSLVMIIDTEMTAFHLHVNPNEVEWEYYIPDDDGSYSHWESPSLRDVSDKWDRLAKELEDATGWDLEWIEVDINDENVHSWY